MHTLSRQSLKDKERAFTLIELIVVIAVLAVLTLTILPVMAGGWEKSSRIQCANNLRQLHTASMQYANSNQDWLPIYTHPSSGQVNIMRAAWYARYVWQGRAQWPVPPSPTQPLGQFQNAGHLYGAGLIDNGQALYCPSLAGKNHFLSAERYRTLYGTTPLFSDQGGVVRSSYSYNPRVVNPNVNDLRRFQQTSDLEPETLFIVDHIQAETDEINHDSERGWNVLLTDGSVYFSTSKRANQLVALGQPERYNNIQLERIFDLLEEER